MTSRIVPSNKFVPVTLLLFGLIFASISLVNHYCFRTEALDLGMFNHNLFSFSELKTGYFTLSYEGTTKNYFADHFAPITVLLAPLRYIFGSYTLLLIQIAAIVLSGLGVHKLAKQAEVSNSVANLILVQYLSIWAIYSALAFDFHTNVIAAMSVPWLVYYYRKGQQKKVLVFFAIILLSKENMALWLPFILIGLMLLSKKTMKQYLRFEIPLTLFSFLYAFVAIVLIMPALNDGGDNLQMKWFSHLGEGFSDKVYTIFTHPVDAFMLLFNQPESMDAPIGIKTEFHITMLLSGGLILLFKPKYLVMLIPIYAQKFLSSDAMQWSINDHYSIEFVPIIALALIDFSKREKYHQARVATIALITISTITITGVRMEHRATPWFDNTNIAFYKQEHYQTNINRTEMNEAMGLIPSDASLTVSSNLAPHMAFRDKIYLFPNINDVDYLLTIYDGRSLYPSSKEDLDSIVDALINQDQYELIYFGENALALRKCGLIEPNTDVLAPPKMKWHSSVKNYRNFMKADSGWVDLIRPKAEANGISIDSAIHLDAIYMADQDELNQE